MLAAMIKVSQTVAPLLLYDRRGIVGKKDEERSGGKRVHTRGGGGTEGVLCVHCAAAPVATISFVCCFISPRLTSTQVCVFRFFFFFFARKAGAMPLTFAECRGKPHVTVRDKKHDGVAEAAIVVFRWGRELDTHGSLFSFAFVSFLTTMSVLTMITCDTRRLRFAINFNR